MRKKSPLQSPAALSILSSVISIVVGLLLGFVLLLWFDADHAVMGMTKMLTTGFNSPAKFAKVLYQAAPLIFTGLSVGFAFKTGLFNIGAPGQYLLGAFSALYTGIMWNWPWWAALIAATVGGAFWGVFPGLCKALFNVNEVITSIMFNWIGLYLVNILYSNTPKMLSNYWGGTVNTRTANLEAANPNMMIPKAGLDKLFGSPYMSITIFIAAIISILLYVVLERTTFGYELKSCGFNRNASQYAGMNVKRNIILSMVISGAMAGLGGGIYYTVGTAVYTIEKVLPSMGFNGIPVALLANSNPIGIIFSALFISYIQVGGNAMQPEFAVETIDVIIAVIIYLAAFALLMRNLLSRLFAGRKEKAEQADQILPEHTEPANPVVAVEPTDSVEPAEPEESAEPVEPAEPAESTAEEEDAK